ncbi:hypothetical protein [uncultured Phascolarctobacterium sp.]|uniref:DUF6979 family protein n=1 Tax=uncultured Phascolarctobacterium sp. TaxID=512296 RepID=UPI0025CBDE8B|nr:hypothetical protein [uncultured Phascolarctobacterium sp.]
MIFYQYGEVAIEAYELIKQGKEPEEAWKESAEKLIDNLNSRKKSCQKQTFVGLFKADNGKVNLNAEYARQALVILDEIPKEELEKIKPREFWETKMKNVPKSYNSQLDVVFALRSKGYI